MSKGKLKFLIAPLLALTLSFCGGCKREPVDQEARSEGTTPAAPTSLMPIKNMVRVNPGSFHRPKQKVTITHEFWISKYEVTQAEFQGVAGKNPSLFQEAGSTNSPVEKVTHLDATAYCAELTRRERAAGRLPPDHEYRLPTEAEWEYACRAGSTNVYSFGDDVSLANDYAWIAANSEGRTHPVGQKKPNAWGLFDMHGNVWEWCSDWFGPLDATDLVNPVGPSEGKYKVFKGGSWNHDVEMSRPANRFMMAANNGIHFVGFRVVLAKTLP